VKRTKNKRSPRVHGHGINHPQGPVALAIRPAPEPSKSWMLSPEDVTIIKNAICKGATDMELTYCLSVARRYKLDPLKGQIWFVKRWDKSADNGHGGLGAYVWTPQVSIWGKLHLAARDYPDFGSVSQVEYSPNILTLNVEGVKVQGPEWARVRVYKKGVVEPTIGEVYLEEFCPRKAENVKLFWATMPRRMMGKCATSQAIGTAYPELGILKIPEEITRVQEQFSPEGRPLIEPTGTIAAAQAVGEKVIAESKARVAARQSSPAGAAPDAGKVAGATGPGSDTRASATKKIPGLVTIAAGEKPGTITVNVAIKAGPEREQLHKLLTGEKIVGAWIEGKKWYLCMDTPEARWAIREECARLGVDGITKAGVAK
jgi:hypothetical protein